MEYDRKNMARVSGRDLRISTKYSMEMSNFLRGKTVAKAKYLLSGILEKKVAMPVRKFCEGAGHRKGKVGPGKYPQNIAKSFQTLIHSAEKNAAAKGLETNNLVIKNIIVNKGRKQYRNTRRRGITMKMTHVELIVAPEAKK